MGDEANKKTSIEEYTNHAIRQVENWKIEQFTIVAHSIGRCLGLKLNNHFRKKVVRFIGIGAIIPKSNQSFIDCLPFPQKLILPLILNMFGTRPPKKSIRNELCNDLRQSQSEEIVEKFSPESIKLYTSKVNYDALIQESLYVKLTNDKTVSQTIQDKMIKNLNPSKVIEFHSGHLPMIAKPKELADIVNSFIGV